MSENNDVAAYSDPNHVHTERRGSERYRLQAKVGYEVSAVHASGNKRYAANMVNVSRGGICLQSRKPLDPFQVIRITLPAREVDRMLPTLAEVCWIRPVESKKRFWIGLRFLL